MSSQPSGITGRPMSQERIPFCYKARQKTETPSSAKSSVIRMGAGWESTDLSPDELLMSSRDLAAESSSGNRTRRDGTGPFSRYHSPPLHVSSASCLTILPPSKSVDWCAPAYAGFELPVPFRRLGESSINENGPHRTLRRKAPFKQHHMSSIIRSEPDEMLLVETHEQRLAKDKPKYPMEGNKSPSFRAAHLGIQSDENRSKTSPRMASVEPRQIPIPELKALATASGSGPTTLSSPHLPLASSPSTQYSGSTGPWSSRDTTPTSASSCSPGIAHFSRNDRTSQHMREEFRARVVDSTMRSDSSASINLSRNAAKKGDDSRRHHKLMNTGSTEPLAPKPSPKKVLLKTSLPLRSEKAATVGYYDLSHDTLSNEGPLQSAAPVRPRRNSTVELEVEPRPAVLSDIPSAALRHVPCRQPYNRANSDMPSHRRSGKAHSNAREQLTFSADKKLTDLQSKDRSRSSTSLSTRPTTAPTSKTLKPASTMDKSEERQMICEPGSSRLERLSVRLGISGRRPKVAYEVAPAMEHVERRKCPAAGTGHEGYGRYARKGRRLSIGSARRSRDRSASSTNAGSWSSLGRPSNRRSNTDSSIDDSLAYSAEPIVITGDSGHPSGSGDPSTTYDTSTRRPWNSEPSLPLEKQSYIEQAEARATETQSSPNRRNIRSGSRPETTSYEDCQRSLLSSDSDCTSNSSFIQEDSSVSVVDHGVGKINLAQAKKLGKLGNRFQWNPLQAHHVVEPWFEKTQNQLSRSPSISVAICPESTERSIPYYALVDSEDEHDDKRSLQELLEEAHLARSSNINASFEQELRPLQLHARSFSPPTTPLLQPTGARDIASTSQDLHQHAREQESWLSGNVPPLSPDRKLNRLPHIGRIPQVISRRDRQHTPPAASFSRPFQVGNLAEVVDPSPTSLVLNRECEWTVPGIQATIPKHQPFYDRERDQSMSAPARHFNAGSWTESWTESGLPQGPPQMIALSPTHPIRDEDEDREEHDSIVDECVSSNSSDKADSITYLSGQEPEEVKAYWSMDAHPNSVLSVRAGCQKRHREFSTAAPSAQIPHCSDSGGKGSRSSQRHSKRSSAFLSTSPVSPLSPFSIADYTRPCREDGSKDSVRLSRAIEISESGTLQPLADAPSSELPALPEASRYQNTALLDIAERDHESPAGQSDLRFAALMTSRWLSFGRVLFSPAHHIVESSPNQQILVIDGLGNDDWSFYCATTYPKAVVYALKETILASGESVENPRHSDHAPPNHRRAQIPHLAARFPFPSSYFIAVVFRFPAAMSDSILKAALSECKRVLVPGGYVEFSLLDLDVVNMGTHTRRAVRDLKARMISADPQVSLKPVSDNIQGMLGQRGFENLNRCMVGVPVEGKMAPASESASSRSSRDSYRLRERDGSETTSRESNRESRDSDSNTCVLQRSNFALSELISDSSATSDEKITKMVAKVGRWWYTRTYESTVLPGANLKRSIWNNKKMLLECKVRGSGFRLLIAYAQSPSETRRRTMSEPIKITTASSGVGKTK